MFLYTQNPEPMKLHEIQIAELEGIILLLEEENARLQEYVATLKERIRSMITTNYNLESGFDCP